MINTIIIYSKFMYVKVVQFFFLKCSNKRNIGISQKIRAHNTSNKGSLIFIVFAKSAAKRGCSMRENIGLAHKTFLGHPVQNGLQSFRVETKSENIASQSESRAIKGVEMNSQRLIRDDLVISAVFVASETNCSLNSCYQVLISNVK